MRRVAAKLAQVELGDSIMFCCHVLSKLRALNTFHFATLEGCFMRTEMTKITRTHKNTINL